MPRQKKDTDYLAISARIRVLENKLLTRERMEQMVEAREDGEALKILADCGYPDIPSLTPSHVEAALAQAQEALFADLSRALGDNHILPVFQIKYDYHNAKALIKGEAVGTDPARLLVPGGRFPPRELLENYRQGALEGYPAPFAAALAEAGDILADTRDPQLADFLLDRACYAETLAQAQEEKNPFLTGYVQTLVDSLNLRALVRARRAGRGNAFLEKALLPGGTVPVDTLPDLRPEDLPRSFDGELREAAQEGTLLLAGEKGDMTAFERLCDNAVVRTVAAARRVPFGAEPVVGYLFARESEQTAIRIILSGRMAGLSKETIRERLRESYV